jgi:hypothetical protein
MKSIFIILFAGVLSLSASSQVYKGSSKYKSLEQQLNEEYCTGIFKSTEGTILDVASSNSVKSYMNILDWLQGRVAGLQIYNTRSGTRIPVIRGSVPGIYVDEISVSASYLSMINVNDIAIVKIIKTPFFGGFNGSGGAIAIYTLGGEEDEEEETK